MTDSKRAGPGAGGSTDRCAPEVLERSYRAYVAAFNSQDFATLAEYVEPGVYFERGEWPPLDGRDEFFGFYRTAFDHLHERVTIDAMTITGHVLEADITVELDVFRDWPDFPGGPMRKGQHKVIKDEIRYFFKGARIARIEPRT